MKLLMSHIVYHCKLNEDQGGIADTSDKEEVTEELLPPCSELPIIMTA
jgi:hypothetical protein